MISMFFIVWCIWFYEKVIIPLYNDYYNDRKEIEKFKSGLSRIDDRIRFNNERIIKEVMKPLIARKIKIDLDYWVIHFKDNNTVLFGDMGYGEGITIRNLTYPDELKSRIEFRKTYSRLGYYE